MDNNPLKFKKCKDGSWLVNIPYVVFLYWDKQPSGNVFEILVFERWIFYL